MKDARKVRHFRVPRPWMNARMHAVAKIGCCVASAPSDLVRCGRHLTDLKDYRMIGAIARKLFGSSNERRIKSYRPRVDGDQRAGAGARGALRRGAARAHGRVQAAGRRGHDARRHPGARPSPPCREAAKRTLGPAPFRRAADRRHGPARGQHRRDEDRRRQDAGRDPAGLSQCARRARRARGHGQRLPRQARRRMDGPDLQLPRPHRRRDRARARRRAAQERLRLPTSPTAPTTSSASTICATT